MPSCRTLARLTLTVLLAIQTAGCLGIFRTKTVVINSVCQFPGLPFNYSQKRDTEKTVQNARALNDAYASACPGPSK